MNAVRLMMMMMMMICANVFVNNSHSLLLLLFRPPLVRTRDMNPLFLMVMACMAEDDAWLLCTTFKQLLGYQLIRLQRRTILFQRSLSSQKIQHLEALFHYSNKNIPFVDNPSNALEMPLVQKYQTDHFMCKADRKSEVRQCLGFFS